MPPVPNCNVSDFSETSASSFSECSDPNFYPCLFHLVENYISQLPFHLGGFWDFMASEMSRTDL